MKETIHIALIQAPLVWHNADANRKYFTSIINRLPKKIELVILPEMFTSGFTMNPEEIPIDESQKTLDWMRSIAKEQNLAVLGSTVFTITGKHYNRLFFVTPAGKVSQYDKRHLFTLAGEHIAYQAGQERLLVHYKGFVFCPMICYDLRFPVWSRNTEFYDVLVYVANWPAPRIDAWDSLLKARAIENMAYSIGVNRVGQDLNGHTYPGHSAVYDPMGNLLQKIIGEDIIIVQLDKNIILQNRQKFSFLEDRDSFSFEG